MGGFSRWGKVERANKQRCGKLESAEIGILLFSWGCKVGVEGCYIKERRLENRGEVGHEKIVDVNWEDI